MVTRRELLDSFDALKENTKRAKTSARILERTTSELASLNECLDSKYVARTLARFEKSKDKLARLLPELEGLDKELERIDDAYAQALKARRADPDPGGARELARELDALQIRFADLAEEIGGDPFQDFAELESKAMHRVSKLFEDQALEEMDLGEIRDELEELGPRLEDALEEDTPLDD
jgi:hypothetical protein